MTYPSSPNVLTWIKALPPVNQWNKNTLSLCIFSSGSASLNLSVTKKIQTELSFSLVAEVYVPISLWSSNSFHLEHDIHDDIDKVIILPLFLDIIKGVLKYGPKKKLSFRRPAVMFNEDFSHMFNLAFFTLALLVCIYEAPQDIRRQGIQNLRLQLASPEYKQGAKLLARVIGSNIEEQWMRSLNLGITNWIVELQASGINFLAPSPLFSYSLSASNLWKVQLYCPIVAMSIEEPSNLTHDERLLFSLQYQHVEAVIQLGYRVVFRDNWIDIIVNVDNIRCDIIPLVSESMMMARGYGSEEKHFPSRISLQLTPTLQSDVLSVSVSKSTENPIHEVGVEKGLESSFNPPNSLGLAVSASETITMSMKPWKFEQSVYGNSTNLNWFLHDGVNGREVFTMKPSKCAFLRPRAWFRNRYSTAYRTFTKQGGIIFARDEYGDSVCWKVSGGASGKIMEWEIKVKIWLTYWPNKQRTFHSETRMLEVRETVSLPLIK